MFYPLKSFAALKNLLSLCCKNKKCLLKFIYSILVSNITTLGLTYNFERSMMVLNVVFVSVQLENGKDLTGFGKKSLFQPNSFVAYRQRIIMLYRAVVYGRNIDF